MSYYGARNFYGADVDYPEPADEVADWASRCGYRDGFDGGVSEEGLTYLREQGPREILEQVDVRGCYVSGYWEGFLNRKLRAHEITKDEFFFYDTYPGRWGRYYEEVA